MPTKFCPCSNFPSHIFPPFPQPGTSAHHVLLLQMYQLCLPALPSPLDLPSQDYSPSPWFTLCLVVSSTPLLLHAVCCFSRYPLPPAILGKLCAHFVLSLYLEWTKLLFFSQLELSAHVLETDHNKTVYKNVHLQQSLWSEPLYNICPFLCHYPISLFVPTGPQW